MQSNEQFRISVSRRDWSLDRRAERDEKRHNEKVKESIKDNLRDIVSDGDVITSDPLTRKKIKIPLKSVELPKFKFGQPKEGIGMGDGDGDGKPQPGDVMEGEAGDQPGEEYYEAEMTLAEIQAAVFEDLGLPNIKPKDRDEVTSETVTWNDIRHLDTPRNLSMHHTVMRNILRNAMENGNPEFGDLIPDDFRVHSWEEERKPENNAVVIAMADISGSMGDREKYLTRAFCWWTVSFLRTKYPNVEIVFVAHDTEAHEVSEEQFFTRGAGGGTMCSSANRMALDLVTKRFPTSRYNVYPLHFSDGDNFGSDNQKSTELVQQLLAEDVNQYAYVQVGRARRSQLLQTYDENIHDERFKGVVIENDKDVLEALRTVFNPE